MVLKKYRSLMNKRNKAKTGSALYFKLDEQIIKKYGVVASITTDCHIAEPLEVLYNLLRLSKNINHIEVIEALIIQRKHNGA